MIDALERLLDFGLKKVDVWGSFPEKNKARILMAFISTLIVIPTLTIIGFSVYMNFYDFFSYDFYEEGVFGMSLFFLYTVFILVMLSFVFWGWWYVAIGWEKLDKPKVGFFISLVISALFVTFALFKMDESGEWIRGLGVLSLTGAIAFHLSVLLFLDVSRAFASLTLIGVLMFYLCVHYPKVIADMIGMGLNNFGMGYVNAKVNYSKDKVVEGCILLVSPSNIYVIPNGKEPVMRIPARQLIDFQLLDRPKEGEKSNCEILKTRMLQSQSSSQSKSK